ncbi:ribonuclease T2 family protein [Mesorhizobium sp. A623]
MAGRGRKLLPAALALAVLGLAACAPAGNDANESEAAKGASAQTDAATVQGNEATSPRKKPGVPQGTGFDFYVLSLSWSPSYCEAEGGDANRQQCGSGRPYAFVVHGLWPQYERGYPQKCGTDEPKITSQTLRALYDLMPSAGLIRHEWQKHGSCTGLSQSDYFDVLRAAREKVAVPAEFRRLDAYRTLSPEDAEVAFLRANAGLPPDGIAVTCDRRFLREVRICMTKDLDFRACDEVDRRSCHKAKVVMPPVRGG